MNWTVSCKKNSLKNGDDSDLDPEDSDKSFLKDGKDGNDGKDKDGKDKDGKAKDPRDLGKDALKDR